MTPQQAAEVRYPAHQNPDDYNYPNCAVTELQRKAYVQCAKDLLQNITPIRLLREVIKQFGHHDKMADGFTKHKYTKITKSGVLLNKIDAYLTYPLRNETAQPQLSRSVLEEVLQKALDYLHSNVTASIVYEDYHDFSKGIKGAEVDFFPETSSDLLAEMQVNLDDLLPAGDGWVDVKDRLPMHGVVVLVYRHFGAYDTAYWHEKFDWVVNGSTHAAGITHWQPLPKAPNS